MKGPFRSFAYFPFRLSIFLLLLCRCSEYLLLGTLIAKLFTILFICSRAGTEDWRWDGLMMSGTGVGKEAGGALG